MPVIARQCRRVEYEHKPTDFNPNDPVYVYLVDTGETIIHRYNDGSAALAVKMLENVKSLSGNVAI